MYFRALFMPSMCLNRSFQLLRCDRTPVKNRLANTFCTGVSTSCAMDTTWYLTAPPKFARSTRLSYSRYFAYNVLASPSVNRVPYWGGRNSSLNTTRVTAELSTDTVAASTVVGMSIKRSEAISPHEPHDSDLAFVATPHSRRSLQTPAARSSSKSPVWI